MHSLSLLSRMPQDEGPEQSGFRPLLRRCDEMLHLADLAEHFGRALHFDGAVQLVEAEADERRPLGLVAADRRSGLGDLDLRHHAYSVTASAWASASAALAPPRPSRSATFLPRRWATERGLVCSFSASKVARIML